jgi:alpha-galactosidase
MMKKYFKAISAMVFALVMLAMPALVLAESAPVIAHGDPATPLINGPRIVGGSPGKPFMFMIPATGEQPLTFSAKNLPDGLTLDSRTGIIKGMMQREGDYAVDVYAANPLGTASGKLTIVCGRDKLALTPPMGWNSWNVWGLSVSSDKVKAAADAMVKSGLASHGFQYINIDDGWEKERAAKGIPLVGYVTPPRKTGRTENGEILTNDKFPNMKALAEYVHSKGLKLGIYSSPGPWTCGGYQGSYQFEQQDAETYAKWGIDYLKYDWCSYGTMAGGQSLADYQKPYIEMGKYLRATERDIVFSLCQYGMKDVWEWGASVGGNLWRTTGDIRDSWKSLSGIGFKQAKIAEFAGPGHWNDPDMLVVGKVGWGPTLHETKLSKTEQMTHITMWAMLAAPLLIGCDMSNLDQFTLDLLTNDDVLAVDQDPLGKQAVSKKSDKKSEIWARPLSDGSMAVALFNKSEKSEEISVTWKELGAAETQKVRDLWQRKDLGLYDARFSATVPPHGTALIKASPVKK